MNCRDIQKLLLAEPDGALTSEERAALAHHVAGCPACRRTQAALATAVSTWRKDAATVAVPDAEQEWQALRPKIAAGRAHPAAARRLAPIAWIGVPLAAAAAVTFALLGGRSSSASRSGPAASAGLARAEFVEVKDGSASPVVYVDKESGWLVVWAVPDAGASG